MSTLLVALVVVGAAYAGWYINKLYSTPLKPTFAKKVEPVVEVKKEEPVVEVKKVRKPRAKKTTKKKVL